MLNFLIPAYNEQENINTLLENIKKLGYRDHEYHVIVVNDGSSDNTLQIVEKFQGLMPLSIVSHLTNQGVGAVFRTGFDVVLKNAKPSDVIITMEADNTSDLTILAEMLEYIHSGSDLVLASCYAPGGRIEGTNLWRKLLSWGANLLLVLALPIKGVNTYSSFYRAYNAGFLQKAMQTYQGKLIEQPGFVCMVEVLVKMKRIKARIVEVPMVLNINNRKGSSKMRIWQTIRGYISFIFVDIYRRNKRANKDLHIAQKNISYD